MCERTFLLRAVGNRWEVQPEVASGEHEQLVGPRDEFPLLVKNECGTYNPLIGIHT